MSHSFLYIFNQAPHSQLNAKEGLDFAFAAAAFGQDVSVLFNHDGVLQTLVGQDCSHSAMKNHSSGLEALALYGIEKAYVAEQALSKRGIKPSALLNDLKPVNQSTIKQLINSHNFVFHY